MFVGQPSSDVLCWAAQHLTEKMLGFMKRFNIKTNIQKSPQVNLQGLKTEFLPIFWQLTDSGSTAMATK